MAFPGPFRLLPVLFVAAAVPLGCLAQEKAPAPADTNEVVTWLNRLEAKGKDIKSLEARIRYVKENVILGDVRTRIGDGVYLAGQTNATKKTPTRFAIRFEHLLVGSKRHAQKLDYVFDGQWFVERDHAPDRKMFIKRQVAKPGEHLDPFKVDGPFPLPLGLRTDDVLGRFNVQIIKPDDKTDPKAPSGQAPLHLQLKTRAVLKQAKGRARYKHIDLWFDRKELLPIRVHLVGQGGQETTVDLAAIKINQVDPKTVEPLFDIREPKKGDGWRVEVDAIKP